MSRLGTRMKGKLTRDNMIILALLGILMMVIALPTGKKEEDAAAKSGLSDSNDVMINSDEVQSIFSEEEALEKRLEDFLSCMEGVGSVKVMLTFSAGPEEVVEKDGPVSRSQTSENDSAGGSRSVTLSEQQQDTVFTTDQAGNQVPYVKKTLAASVEGVTVLAAGGDSPVIQKHITDVIEALFGIEAHKIKVAKMETVSGE